MSEDVWLAIIGIFPQLVVISVVATLGMRHRAPINDRPYEFLDLVKDAFDRVPTRFAGVSR